MHDTDSHGADIETEIDDRHGRITRGDGDPLSNFEFGFGDLFVRWDTWGDCRADDDVWSVINIRFEYRQTWVTERDNMPMIEDHRQYELLSKETFDTRTVSERDLMHGDWKYVDEEEVGDD